MSIHTRNLKYGKLTNGQFLTVPPALIKRIKQAFVSLPFGVDIILGKNGYIWISQHQEFDEEGSQSLDPDYKPPAPVEVDRETREKICRVRNSIVALRTQFIAIYPDTIIDTYDASVELGLHPKDMLDPQHIDIITQKASERKKRFE